MTFYPSSLGSQSQISERYRSAPVAGVNRVDNTRALDNGGFAHVIDNYICRPDGLTVRPGFAVVSTVNAAVTSLLDYPGQVLARTDGDWIGETIANAGGQHLLAAKGNAPLIHYNGVSWDTPTILNVDQTKIGGIIQHNGRFFGYITDDLELVYLPLRAFAGSAGILPMQAYFNRGGSVVAIGSMTNDGGELGGDSLAVVSTEGQLAIYDGNNPEFPDSWRLRGVYDVPKPVGRRCFTRTGGSLVLLTVDGLLDVPGQLPMKKSSQSARTLTRNIGTINGAVSTLDSRQQKVTLIHAGSEQWVQDSETNGWSRWLDLNATCWLDGHDGLYFGRSDGSVCRMGAGLSDGVSSTNAATKIPIKTLIIDAFAPFGTPRPKIFHRVRPHHFLARPYRPRLEMITNHRQLPPSWTAQRVSHRYWMWDDVSYGMMPAYWEREQSSQIGKWRGIAGQGDAAALVYGAQFLETESVMIGYDVEFEITGGR